MWSERGCRFLRKVCVCVGDILIERWVMNLQVVLSPAHAHELTNAQWRKKNLSAKESMGNKAA